MAFKPRKLLDDQDEVFNRWGETRDLKPIDQLLRRHGFAIHKRPNKGENLWVKDGKVYTESEALRTIPWDELRKAQGEPEEKSLKGGLGR